MTGHSLPAAVAGQKLTAAWGPIALLGMVIGFAPVFAGLIFRTYSYGVVPNWAEALRQADVPFIFIELAVIMWAREKGLRPGAILGLLDARAKFAISVFMCTFWVSSLFVSEQPAYSMIRASFWLIHIGFGFAVFHLCRGATRRDVALFTVFLCAGLLAFVPLMAVHLAGAPDPSTQPGGRIIWSSAIPGCLSVRHLGIWSALVIGCAAGTLYRDDLTRGHATLAVGAIFIGTALLFWSGTRAGLFGLAGAGMILIATVRRLPPVRFALPALVAGISGVLVASLVWIPPDNAFGLLTRAIPDGDLDTFSSGRLVLWYGMMKEFATAPLLGSGEGAILWLVQLPGGLHHVQPHNSVVQMLSSWGIIATTAFAYLLVRLLIVMHRAAVRHRMLIALAVMTDCLLIMSLADGVLFFSRFIAWFAGASAVVLAVHCQTRARVPSDELEPTMAAA